MSHDRITTRVESMPTDMPHIMRLHWQVWVAYVLVGGIFGVLSPFLTNNLGGFVLPVLGGLVVIVIFAHRLGKHYIKHILTLGTVGFLTAALVYVVGALVLSLPEHRTDTGVLLRDAALVWVANVDIFAIWYWVIDGGGPFMRAMRHHEPADFMFPQRAPSETRHAQWKPDFVDYIFLAFNTSTAFSPTDTIPLSHTAKWLMMLQSALSLVVIAVLGARAVNIL